MHWIFIGILLSVTGWILDEIISIDSERVYHTQRESQAKPNYAFIFMVSIRLSLLLLSSFVDAVLLIKGIVSLIILSMMATSDITTGRIPVFTFVLSIPFGVYTGMLNSDIVFHLLGGLFNIFLALIIF